MLFQEIRQAVRVVFKNPGLTAVAGLSLAIGIGVNSALFSLTDGLLLRPLAIAEPDEVVTVVTDSKALRAKGSPIPTTAICATKAGRSPVWLLTSSIP
jgi:hypothetical protein